MSELSLRALPLEGLFSLQHKAHEDERGRFARLFCQGSLAVFGQPLQIRQINHSRTALRGTVRVCIFSIHRMLRPSSSPAYAARCGMLRWIYGAGQRRFCTGMPSIYKLAMAEACYCNQDLPMAFRP